MNPFYLLVPILMRLHCEDWRTGRKLEYGKDFLVEERHPMWHYQKPVIRMATKEAMRRIEGRGQ
jgi:hypothetical protein